MKYNEFDLDAWRESEDARRLTPAERDAVQHAMEAVANVNVPTEFSSPAAEHLTVFEEAVVNEYANQLDVKETARRLWKEPGTVRMALMQPRVEEAVKAKLAERAARTELTGDYVRGYIRELLELCPTDYFVLAEDGTWMIDPHHFRDMPSFIKRYVERIDIRRVKGEFVLSIQFMSKTAALAMAARYAMVQKVEHMHTIGQPNWGDIAGEVKSIEHGGELEALLAEAGKA